MTNQLQGELLFKGWAGNSLPSGADTWVYTPWLPVGGDHATFAVEVVSVTSGTTFKWAVDTRTRESASTTEIVSAQTVSTAGVSTAENTSAALELVRYRFSTGSTASVTEFAVFRALSPSWQVDR